MDIDSCHPEGRIEVGKTGIYYCRPGPTFAGRRSAFRKQKPARQEQQTRRCPHSSSLTINYNLKVHIRVFSLRREKRICPDWVISRDVGAFFVTGAFRKGISAVLGFQGSSPKKRIFLQPAEQGRVGTFTLRPSLLRRSASTTHRSRPVSLPHLLSSYAFSQRKILPLLRLRSECGFDFSPTGSRRAAISTLPRLGRRLYARSYLDFGGEGHKA